MMKKLLFSFVCAFVLNAAAFGQHPVNTAHIVSMDGKLELVFDLPVKTAFRLEILDLTGTPIHSQKVSPSSDGCEAIDLPTENLRKGIYFVQVISDDGKSKSLKLQRN